MCWGAIAEARRAPERGLTPARVSWANPSPHLGRRIASEPSSIGVAKPPRKSPRYALLNAWQRVSPLSRVLMC